MLLIPPISATESFSIFQILGFGGAKLGRNSSYTLSAIYSGFVLIREAMANTSIDLHATVVDRLG